MTVYSPKVCAGCPDLKVNRGDWGGHMALPFCDKDKSGNGPIVPHDGVKDGDRWVVKFTRVPEHCTNPDKMPSKKPAPVSAHAVVIYGPE